MHATRKKIIGTRLKSLRLENGISQKDLANSIETSVQTITQIETFRREPTLDIIEKYSNYFSIPIEDIVRGLNQISKSLNIESTLDTARNLILEAMPIEIPVYSHREFLDPKKQAKPIDKIYWYREKINNRNLFAIHVQTANLDPDIQVNDRIIIDPDLPICPGFGLRYDGRARSNFSNTKGVHVVRFEAAEKGKYVSSNNYDDVRRIVEKNMYKGMVIQIIRYVPIRGLNVVHKNLEEGVDINSMRSSNEN